MNRLAETNVWNDARAYAPDCFDQLAAIEHYERLARKARREAKSAIAWGDMLFGAACGLVVGMLGTVGLAYVWALFL
jgi:hypothetical protein